MPHTTSRIFLLAASFGLASTAAQADFVIADDLIVDGSACIGFDCVNGESFSFDTIRLKENNLRIKFDDTSTAASYPRNDWQLTANDSANGGVSKFSIDDISGGRTPFTVEANARSHSLYVDDGGRIGNRTSTPTTEFHTIDGDSPTIRLQQDGSSGFAPQTWDLAGNETSFFVRDVSNGSTLPFRIRPGAPSNALVIDAEGEVGIGVLNADGRLHTRGSGVQIVYFESSDDNAVQVRMRTDSGNRRFLATDGSDNVETQIIFDNDQVKIAGPTDTGANLWATIDATGITTQGGTCNVTPCDRTFDPSYFEVPPIAERAAYMWENMHLPAVGPTKADAPINITEKTTGMLHELEIAHIYIEQLDAQMRDMQATHAAEIKALTERLTALEAQ